MTLSDTADENDADTKKAGAVCCLFFAITEEEKKRLDQMPVVIHGQSGMYKIASTLLRMMWQHYALKSGQRTPQKSCWTNIDLGELQPPPANLLKFVNARSITNTIVTNSGRHISAPPLQSQNIVPEALKAETLAVANRIIPSISADGRDPAFWRLCWDLITPEQHQLITKHPHKKLKNLYLAIGGSFHSWKFLPIIGKYVANMIQGISNGDEKDRNWSWKETGWSSPRKPGAHEAVIPKRSLEDFGC